MLNNSQNVLITGGQFNVNTISTAEKGLKLLQERFISGALHNSAEQGDSPKCHENTRVAVIEEIMAWVNNSDRQTRVLWMNGAAGSGKTAIAHTIAEKCYEAGILAASFFCSRSVSGRNEKTFLITTIVSQLIVAIPRMREYVGNVLHMDHSLLSRSLETQLEALIVRPLQLLRSQIRKLLELGRQQAVISAGISANISADIINDIDFLRSHPKFIILDGLDECGDSTSHQSVLRLILVAINKYNLPFFFLIASRPEQKIREAFNESAMGRLTVRLALDDKYLPDEDIRTFLVSKFQDIKERHPSGASLPLWPPKNDIERLVQKSSGQFIYASTVIKFIDSHRHWPPDRLDIIFGILPPGKTTPFAEIDALYSYILSAASDNIGKILDIFTVLLFLQISHHDWTPTMQFLESFLLYRPGEIFMVLSDMHSIISVPFPHQQYMTPRFLHASLGDFLVDRSRSGEDFFLNPGVAHRKIATWIMNKIQTPTPYLGEEFADHCLKSIPTPEFLSHLCHYDLSHLFRPTEPWGGEMFVEIFDAVHADSQIPTFLVWLQRQLCPGQNEVNGLHLYAPGVDTWIHGCFDLFSQKYDDWGIYNMIVAAATLVNFPGFQDAHEVISNVFNVRSKPNRYHYDPEEWEIYVKHRQLLAEFLTDERRSGPFFVGTSHYLQLAKYFWSFLTAPTTVRGKVLIREMWIDRDRPRLEAVTLALPEVLSMCGTSVELAVLLKDTQLANKPWIEEEWSDGDWEALIYDTKQTWKAYRKSVLKRGSEGQNIRKRRKRV